MNLKGCPDDIYHCSNTTKIIRSLATRIKKNVRENGAKLVVADPRKTDLASMADVHMRFRPVLTYPGQWNDECHHIRRFDG
jgi:hypothetical protein